MLRAAIGFFIIAIFAFAIGAGNLGVISMDVGMLLLKIFLILAVLSLIVSLVTGRGPKIP